MYADLMIDIIRTATITFISAKLMKMGGKKDIGELIAIGGFSIIGIDVAKMIKYLVNHPPEWYTTTTGTAKNIAITIEKIGNIFDKINQTGVNIENFFGK